MRQAAFTTILILGALLILPWVAYRHYMGDHRYGGQP